MAKKDAQSYFPALDGFRAIAMLAVLLFHIVILFQASLPDIFVFDVLRLGFYGVDLFFLISGFVITQHYHAVFQNHVTIKEYASFLKRRLQRTYPVHLFILIVLATMIIGAPFINATIQQSGDYTVTAFIQHLLLISAWDFPAQLTWNHYAWAISALWLCYIAAPFYMWAVSRAPMALRIVLALLCLLITPLIAYYIPHESTATYAIPRALSGFFLGGLIATFYHAHYSIVRYSIVIACACIIIGTVTPLRFTGLGVLAACVIYGLNVRILNQRLLCFFGQRSYSLYMVQFPILMIFKKLVLDRMAEPLSPILLIAFMGAIIASVMIAGIVTYMYIERRFNSR